jgi:hypothetical protein
LMIPIIFGEQSSSLYSFLQRHVTSSVFGPNIFYGTLFSNTLSVFLIFIYLIYVP